jgi:uncharacterized BrkB/YihY/UPF0761 family membrane protein
MFSNKLMSYGWRRLAFALVLLIIILSPLVLIGTPAFQARSSQTDGDVLTYAMWFLAALSLLLFGIFLFLLFVSLYSEVEDRRARAHALGGTILNWFLTIGTGAAGVIGFTRF